MLAQLDRTFLHMAPGRAVSRLIGYSMFEGRPATTRGRSWNPVVFANLRLAARRTGETVKDPVFIVGMGRSGTTLLGRILAAHPNVGFLNEPKALWHVVRPDEDIIGSYGPSHSGRLCLGAADADEDVCRRAHALFGWYLRASGSQRLVDKYPELVFRADFVRAIFPDVRFLVAVRSPWSTLESVVRWSELNGTGDADWWGVNDQKWHILWREGVALATANRDLLALDLAAERNHLLRAAVEWVVTMRRSIEVAADRRSHLVHYDELVRRPREIVRDALEFCDLPASPRTEAYAATIVAAPERSAAMESVLARLPEGLAGAVAQTWSELQRLKSPHVHRAPAVPAA